MSDIKIIATTAYFIFLVLGGIWGLVRANSERALLDYAIEQTSVEIDNMGNTILVYHCSETPYISYDVNNNKIALEESAFNAFSSIDLTDSETPFKLGTLTTLMGGAFGGWTIKDVYKFSNASKFKIVARRSITIVVSAITGFGVGYSLGILLGNNLRSCDSKRIISNLNTPEFWNKLEESIFRNAVYNISVNHKGSKRVIPEDYKAEINRIYTSETPYIDINSASFDIIKNANETKLEFIKNQKWYTKSWVIIVLTATLGPIIFLGVLLFIEKLNSKT
ncbi:hypothetical protein KZP23_16745 [Echinicola marina]|uniref:hypothetical protein n=1 Tax=Echinicola marina TaxID=2859768 RepID=UPI001CF6B53E|nr:hypothetical protein [Echinicola marina]UCS92338.1 hypothetical protein KZP23_16745 [Echinicola marina]